MLVLTEARESVQLYTHVEFDSLSSQRRRAKILFWQRAQAKQGYYFANGGLKRAARKARKSDPLGEGVALFDLFCGNLLCALKLSSLGVGW